MTKIKTVSNNLNRVTDMPKIESPFVREENEDGDYVVTDEINEGYEWVFERDRVMAVEKLHGSNVSVTIEQGNITAVFNRKNRIPPYSTGKRFITKAILNSVDRNYTNLKDGQWFGEVVGPKLHGNPYDLDEHLWIPFQRYGWKHLKYKSWGEYPKDFETISRWFKEDLIPLFYSKIHGVDFDEARENGFVEGIVFTDPKTMEMAKLRRDQFEWYEGPSH